MKPAADVDELRQQAILSARAGFPFLLVFAFVWLAAAGLSYVLPPGLAPWAYLVLGLPATPVAIAVERRGGYVPAAEPDPLLPLTLQLFFVQVVASPAVLLVWDQSPEYVPVAFAALVGGHFLPFQWIYRTRLYAILGVAVALGPFLLALLFQDAALHYTGFFVGTVLLCGALAVRSHARAIWRSTQRDAGRRTVPLNVQ